MNIIGLDEAGFGAIAGPLTVGAVGSPFIIPFYWPEVDDSKAVHFADREWIFKMMQETVPWAVGMATHHEIDEMGLGRARRLAAQRALRSLLYKYPYHRIQKFQTIIVDGNQTWGLNDKADLANEGWYDKITTVIKADTFIKEVSAASIAAKVVRDDWMRAVSPDFPQYGFDQHVGYGTKDHMAALKEFGPCYLHRRSTRPVAALVSDSEGIDDDTWDRRKHKKPRVSGDNPLRFRTGI